MASKVYWYPCGPRRGNFGDLLTALLFDYFNHSYEWAPAEDADFIGIGSICQQIPVHFRGIVWTTGNLRESHKNDFRDAQVVALRGKSTLERTKCSEPTNVLLGDGGLLCHLFASPVRKRYKLGLVPHFVDHDHALLKEIANTSPEICWIDICDEPHSVIRRVSQCENILSSSLHGLILADSLGIPNRWMQAFGEVLGAGFKFHDYYSVFRIERPQPLVVSPADTLDTLLPHIVDYNRPNIASLQESMLRSFEDILGTKRNVKSRPFGPSTVAPSMD